QPRPGLPGYEQRRDGLSSLRHGLRSAIRSYTRRPGNRLRLSEESSSLRGKHQRLDDDRHGARGLEQRADVDEVEFLQDDPVDRDDRVGEPGLLAAVDPDQSSDVAVSDQDKRESPF